MDYRLVYTRNAEDDLAGLDKQVSRRILKKVATLLKNSDPMRQAVVLIGLADYYRFRVGDYRVIFRTDRKNKCLVILVVLRIGHRKAIYRGELM